MESRFKSFNSGVGRAEVMPPSGTSSTATSDNNSNGANKNIPQGPTAPAITLPTGGGAIRGLGEKFSVNPVNGTATAQVPIPVTSGRDGHGPLSLSISYASDSGNGPWGIGWKLSVGSVSRKTDKGLPKYDDSDVFIFEGLEDLVPRFRMNTDGTLVADSNGQYMLHIDRQDGWIIQRFAPRIESNFVRIERWTNEADPVDEHWKALNPDGSVSLFGLTDESRVFDETSSGQAKKIFSWQICQTYDTKGNCTVFKYKREDSTGVDLAAPSETNRSNEARGSNLYLKSIRYGNRQANRDLSTWQALDASKLPDDTWMFEVVLDYGEHDLLNPKTTDKGVWLCRKDPFSVYRSSFEVRTYRLCHRVLMFHHFPKELGQADYLVWATTFQYEENDIATYMTGAARTGYMTQSGSTTSITQSFPPLNFEYSRLPTPEELDQLPIQTLDGESTEGFPSGFSGAYQPVDLDGDGLSSILFETDKTWFYKRNVSANNITLGQDKSPNTSNVAALFQPPVVLPVAPNASLDESFQLLALTGTGKLDAVDVKPGTAGFYERSLRTAKLSDGKVSTTVGWNSFQYFPSFPNVNLSDTNTRFIDITGDGLADILISEDDQFIVYQSAGTDGFLPGQIVPLTLDEERGPRVLFSDPEHTIFLADMSGDGLSDLVRVSKPGVVCYWPSLGYGRFGAKIAMGNSPVLDYPDQFDARRIRLVDVDGSGTSDILYLARDHVQIYRNCSGNAWSDRQLMSGVPAFDNLVSVQAMDLLGRGTGCLIWSSGKPGDTSAPVHYVDLMNGVKPHLLVRAWNNMGAETNYTYTPSTEFYLDDEAAGKPWYTRIPFPVHCVSKIETYDHISRSRFSSRYAYHHGFYDGYEREFRGFASVDHWDTEEYNSLDIESSDDAVNWDSSFVSPPVRTKQFYHTGAYLEADDLSELLAAEYFGAPSPFDKEAFAGFIDSQSLKNSMPKSLAPGDMREACRSFKGLMLREEVYTEDNTPKSGLPHNVTSSSYSALCLQPQDMGNQHSVWISHQLESVKYQYERQINDPRISHTISLQKDQFGNDLKSLSICYGMLNSSLTGVPKLIQEETLITYSEQNYTNFIDNDTSYVLPHPSESRVYEITGIQAASGNQFLRNSDFARDDFQPLKDLLEVPYETVKVAASKSKRLAHKSRVLYRSDDLSHILPLGTVESQALTGLSYAMAFTPGMIAKFSSNATALLPTASTTLTQNGYVDLDGDSNWWVPSGRSFFHPSTTVTSEQELAEARSHFFYGRRYIDVFGNSTTLDQDEYNLLPLQSVDALGNTIQSTNDYRVLQPYLAVDINGNRSQVQFDALGKVVGSAVMGKSTETLGDNLEGFTIAVSPEDLAEFFKNPLGDIAARLLGNASSRIIYDLGRYYQDPGKGLPAYSATIARETHVTDLDSQKSSKLRVKLSYSDGFNREVQQKNMQEPGSITENGPIVDNRWVGTGWTIFNNKGKEVQKFEAFFDDTHEFKFAKIEGVSPIVLYDAAERIAVTIRPDHAWAKNLYGSWSEVIYDAGDLTLVSNPRNDPDVGPLFQKLETEHYLPSWYDSRKGSQKGSMEQSAATKSIPYDSTPTIMYGDAMGRNFYTVMDNGTDGKRTELSIIDVEGHKLQSIDALGRIVDSSDYNMLGESYHRVSMDTGESWALNDAANATLFNWNGRLQRLHTTYDTLRRVKNHFLMDSTSTTEIMVDTIIYGEEVGDGKSRNACGRHFKQLDQSGIVTMPQYDFKGNLLRQEQQLASNYKILIDWTKPDQVPLEDAVFTSETKYDALNRHLQGTTSDKTLTINVYNEASYVEKIQVNIRGEVDGNGQPIYQGYVTNVDYDAQGRRTKIEYGNGTTTKYSYDPLSSNLITMQTKGPSGTVQDYTYTYDIMGNVTHIEDKVQQTVFFRNQVVEPGMDYTYDPIGRLIQARGRERLEANGSSGAPSPADSKASDQPNLAPNALASYVESYTYDAANNFLEVNHQGNQASQAGWTRKYSYEIPSHIQSEQMSNKLTMTTSGGTTENYRYDGGEGAAGLMTAMSHLSAMKWDFRDHLVATSAQIVQNGIPETTYYVYDARGQRTRKVTERSNNGTDPPRKLKETLYLTGLDIFRKFAGDGSTVKLEKQTFKVVHSDKNVALVETRTISVPNGGTGSTGGTGLTDTDPKPTPLRLINRYQLDNHLGSICVELDDSGGVVSYEEYSAYGSTTYQSLSSEVDADKRYRFANKERDKETGLYAQGARYYAAWIGRWTSADPAGTAGDGLNVFTYARCSPSRYRDPGGTGSSDWRDSLSTMQRAALAADDWVNSHPFVHGVVDNLDKRGEALMNTLKALMELAQKPAGEIVETLAKGVYQLGAETVKAGKNVAVYGYKSATEGGDENWKKLGDATTDLVLNTADIVTTVAGGASAVKSLKNVGTAVRVAKASGQAALESAKATLKEMPAVIKEASAPVPKLVPSFANGVVTTGVDLLPEAGQAKNVLMAVANKTAEGVKNAVAAGGSAGRRTKALAAAIRELEQGTSKVAKKFQAFKAGEELSNKPRISMNAAVEERGGLSDLVRQHHDMPRTLQKLWDAFDINNHMTIDVDLVEHQIIHGTGAFFHDSNVLWAKKLSEVKNLWKLDANMLLEMREEINSTYGRLPSSGRTLNQSARSIWKNL